MCLLLGCLTIRSFFKAFLTEYIEQDDGRQQASVWGENVSELWLYIPTPLFAQSSVFLCLFCRVRQQSRKK